jgi:cytochrome c biogenesis protein CcdA
MTSLSEVYTGEIGAVASRRRRLLGAVLLVAGAAMVGSAIALATTGLGDWLGFGLYGARELAGVLAGLGLPAAMLGVFVVLPATETTRATAVIGASISLFGVFLFGYAYPAQWIANNLALALATTAVYTIGTLVVFWCLFVAVATFKTRNDPGGSARIRITDEGKIRVVDTGSIPSLGGTGSVPSLGGIGLLGSDPDGDVPTQTGRADRSTGDSASAQFSPSASSSQPSPSSREPQTAPEPTSDGGNTVIKEPAGTANGVVSPTTERGRPDRYCGNCEHFEYVRADGELAPYCTLHSELMDDMDACPQWDQNSDS